MNVNNVPYKETMDGFHYGGPHPVTRPEEGHDRRPPQRPAPSLALRKAMIAAPLKAAAPRQPTSIPLAPLYIEGERTSSGTRSTDPNSATPWWRHGSEVWTRVRVNKSRARASV